MRCALFAFALAGCLRTTTFQCETSAQCGADGLCEADNFCSFPSTSCPSGRVYGDNSGPHSNQCVGAATDDAAMPGDAMPDASSCPATYMALPNAGTRGHVYRFVNMDRTWTQHRDACAAEGTFLAFPDGPDAAMELAALRTAAGDGAWVGVDDIANEGTRINSLNMAISAQTQALVDIDGNPTGTDCFRIDTTTLDDAQCSDTRKAVCECVP
jgi:hypothetical protein